ncbi:MAG: RDD family protein [Myxococcales bacterium]|nr:RDD family protein [Myxococcales bacterium]
MTDPASYRLETPEHVELELDLAGPGSRYCAVLLDFAALALGLVPALIAAVIWLPAAIGEHAAGRELIAWVMAIIIGVVALAGSLYHLLFELFMRGQSPGKRRLKLRVVSSDGTAATASQLLIRNLLRIVDFLPAAYGLGGLVSLFSPTHQRIGDYAAGTLVVKEGEVDYRARTDERYTVAAPALATATNAELAPAEQQLLAGFFARREELTPEARWRLSDALARKLHARHGGTGETAEAYLERLASGAHQPSRTSERPA